MPSHSPLRIVVEVLLVLRSIVNVAKTGLPYLEDIVLLIAVNRGKGKRTYWLESKFYSHIVEADTLCSRRLQRSNTN